MAGWLKGFSSCTRTVQGTRIARANCCPWPNPLVTALSDLLTVLRRADPADKAEIYTQLGLRLTYEPSGRIVRA
jgi:hypothetical protein